MLKHIDDLYRRRFLWIRHAADSLLLAGPASDLSAAPHSLYHCKEYKGILGHQMICDREPITTTSLSPAVPICAMRVLWTPTT